MPQFLIREADLKNFYNCLDGHGDVTEALMLLSKPEKKELTPEHVSKHLLLLTLEQDDIFMIISSIAERSGGMTSIISARASGRNMTILAQSVEKGLADQDFEDLDEDEDEDEDEEWGPGDFGHPQNLDGSLREEVLQEKGYCVACKTARVFGGFITISPESGHRMLQGACPNCNTRMNKILI